MVIRRVVAGWDIAVLSIVEEFMEFWFCVEIVIWVESCSRGSIMLVLSEIGEKGLEDGKGASCMSSGWLLFV